jgi:hypothetical protein
MSNGFVAFAKALWCGALVSGGPFLLLTVPIAVEGATLVDPLSLLFTAAIPVLISAVVTLAAMVAIGLPFTAIARHLQCESVALYAFVGAAFGFLIAFLFLMAISSDPLNVQGMLLIVPGILAGGTTAYVWGRWRIAQVSRTEHIAPNRIHDPRILR